MFGRKRDKTNTVVVPPWKETVKIMHGKDMNFADEVIDVVYCADGSVRCVLLKSDLGSYKYLFERLFAYDEDEFVIFGRDTDPGYWQPIYDFEPLLRRVVFLLNGSPTYCKNEHGNIMPHKNLFLHIFARVLIQIIYFI